MKRIIMKYKKFAIAIFMLVLTLLYVVWNAKINTTVLTSFYDPVLKGWVYSETYASYEDACAGTPSDPAAVAESNKLNGTHGGLDLGLPATDSNGNNYAGSSNSSTNRTPSKPATPTLTEYDADSQPTYVVTSKKAVYDDYNKGRNEIGSVSKGTEVVVTGKSSNGYYRFDYTAEDGTTTTGYLLFEGKDNIVPKEDYDAAWAESSRVEATCTKDGYIEYTNSLSGLKYKDELKATGHVLGDEELTLEPTWTKPGEIVTHCAVCNEVIDSREIPPIVPAWAWWLIGGTVAFCVVLITVTIIIVRKRNKA